MMASASRWDRAFHARSESGATRSDLLRVPARSCNQAVSGSDWTSRSAMAKASSRRKARPTGPARPAGSSPAWSAMPTGRAAARGRRGPPALALPDRDRGGRPSTPPPHTGHSFASPVFSLQTASSVAIGRCRADRPGGADGQGIRIGGHVPRAGPWAARTSPILTDRSDMVFRSVPVRRIGCCQTPGDGQAVTVGFQRLFQVSQGALHVARLLVGERQCALPVRVVRSGLAFMLADGQGVEVVLESIRYSPRCSRMLPRPTLILNRFHGSASPLISGWARRRRRSASPGAPAAGQSNLRR